MAEKFQIRIILKNSSEFTVKCDEFNCKKNGLGQLTGISWVGGTENIPLFLDINEIVAIIQLDTILSADVAPVRYGQWVDCNEEAAGCCSEAVHCSLCGEEAPISASDYYCRGGKIRYEIAPFCPNCGAKMDGGEGE